LFLYIQSESAAGASEMDFSSVSDIDTIVSIVNSRFDRKERQMKTDMRDEFEKRLERDSRHHEEVIAALKRDLSHLTKLSHECDTLRERQFSMQQEISEQHEKIVSLREENSQLRAENSKFQQLNEELTTLKSDNASLKREKAFVDVKNLKLLSTVSEKEQEIASLKFLIDTQYKRIKLDLTNTRDKFYNEQESLQNDMKQQHVMLAEISEAVKSLKGPGRKDDKRRDKPASMTERPSRSTVVKIKPFVGGGKSTASSSFTKLSLKETPSLGKKKH